MKAYISLTRSGLRAFFRDRTGLFWSFFFPVFFIVIFGSLFGNSDRNKNEKPFTIGIVLEDRSGASSWVPDVFGNAFTIRKGELKPEQDAMLAGKSNAVIVIPTGFTEHISQGEKVDVQVFYDPTRQQTNPIVTGIIRQMLAGIEQHAPNRESLIEYKDFALTPAGVRKKQDRSIDFIIPGILAMTVIQLGIFTAIPIINMREKGILKRFRATPLPRPTLVASQITIRLIICVIQTMFILFLGSTLYGFRVAGSYPELIGLVVFGALTFVCIGAVLSSIAKTQESGVSLVQLVNLPMMFLSGIFFPPELMGGTVRTISKVLPSTYLADAVRHIALASPSTYSMSTDLMVLSAWLIGGLFIASRVFRWE
jgi:ABC-2 type transport system permease protein